MQELVNFLNKRFEQDDFKNCSLNCSLNFITENNNLYLIFHDNYLDENPIKIKVITKNPVEILETYKCWTNAFYEFSYEYYEYLDKDIKFIENSIFPNGNKYAKLNYQLEYFLSYYDSNIHNTSIDILTYTFNFDIENNKDRVEISKISTEMCFFIFLSSYYLKYFEKNIFPYIQDIYINYSLGIESFLTDINLNTIFCGYFFTAKYSGINQDNQDIERIIDNCLFELSKKNLIFFRDLPILYSKKVKLDYDNLSVSVNKKYDENLILLYKSAMIEKLPSRAFLSFYSILDYCTQKSTKGNKREQLEEIILQHKNDIINDLSKNAKNINFFDKIFSFSQGSDIANFFYHLRNSIYHLDKNNKKLEPYIPYTKIESKIELIIPSIKKLCELLIESDSQFVN